MKKTNIGKKIAVTTLMLMNWCKASDVDNEMIMSGLTIGRHQGIYKLWTSQLYMIKAEATR